MKHLKLCGSSLMIALMVVAGGCASEGKTSLLPNSDPALRKTPAQFAVDAAKRFPFKADAPRGDAKEAPVRAQIHYSPVNKIDVLNLSDEDWTDVEIWVDRSYVVFIPTMQKRSSQMLKVIDFEMLYDDKGNTFKPGKEKPHIEIYKGGKIYEVPLQLGD